MFEPCAARAEALHAADPDLRSLVTTEIGNPEAANLSSQLDVWTPIVNYIDSSNESCPYRFPGRSYFSAHADELLCARSGRRQRSNAARIIQDGLRLIERGRHRYVVTTPVPTLSFGTTDYPTPPFLEAGGGGSSSDDGGIMIGVLATACIFFAIAIGVGGAFLMKPAAGAKVHIAPFSLEPSPPQHDDRPQHDGFLLR